ncbi:sulfurtransferase [Ornithinimicrobium avium]|uniref:Sulfurtransferase n=1 Tax=Ornithinimicrobium avium TaxID=2283195 RepID=A0A345NIY5_9MICO|nr:sulfurtransferase [Ornithinimicrobium avium]AXH94993.1 sulfurtransferase [Ornithinimicrobium avium]
MGPTPGTSIPPTPAAGPLVDPDELAGQLDGDDAPTLVDVRWSLGSGAESNRAAYLEGHLPGAAFLDLESVLSDPVAESGEGGRHPMPAPERVREGLRAAGVRQGRPVVFYDARTSVSAARAWWVASYYGVPARVLDGGLAAWARAGLPVATGEADVSAGDVELTAGGRELLDAADVARWLADGGQLLDARPADRFRGENEVVDPVAGHIPGARSMPSTELLDEDGAFLPAAAVAGRVRSAGASPGARSAVYCGSGVTAAHVALALEARGLDRPAVYVGSWSDWISDPGRPVATGPA